MLHENSNNTTTNSPSHHHHHKKGLLSSIFHHHHHHHHHNHSKSVSISHSGSVSPPTHSLSDSENIITKWDTDSSSFTKVTSLFRHSRREAREFVEAVKGLRASMNHMDSTADLVPAQQLMQTAMKRLERELHQILSENRDRLDPESVSSSHSSSNSSSISVNDYEDELENVNESIAEVERVSALAMADVKSIADCMISCGYGKECIKIYKTLRKSIIDEGLFRLRIERFKSSQVGKMTCEALASAAKTWLNGVRVAVETLFKSEKTLCDHVFSSASDTVRESCFHEITEEAAGNLFLFPEMAAKVTASKKSPPERIFLLMELYEAISGLWPEIESIFGSESAEGVLSQALASSLKLRDSIHSILPEIESSIHHNHSKALVPGGGIHPMTLSVIEYVSKLSDHSGVLAGILEDYPNKANNKYSNANDDPVTVHLAWIILVLLCKLDSKAEYYKDASLSYLFLANNLNFVVEKVKATELRKILCEDWVSNHEKKIHQYAQSYESMAWTKVFYTIPDDNHTVAASPAEAREAFGQFSAAFEEEYKKQTSWIVQDRKLRDELKVSIASKLVPMYREFYDSNVDIAASAEGDFVILSPEDLGNYLSDLFHGTTSTRSFKSFSPSLSSLTLSSSSPRKGLSR